MKSRNSANHIVPQVSTVQYEQPMAQPESFMAQPYIQEVPYVQPNINYEDNTMSMCPNPNSMQMNDECSCHNRVDTDKICAKCAKICYLNVKKEWVEDLVVNKECAQHIASVNVKTNNLTADNACLSTATINNLCVTNLNAPNFSICNTYRAYLGLTADYTYTLGTNLQFNAVLDDPSAMSSQIPTTHFTAPVAGYYDINAFINASNLLGSVIVVGTPVASLSIQVNGISRTSILTPFLAFSPSITDTLTASLLLNVGDQVTAVLNVLVQDPTAGEVAYVGTMLISGGAFTTVDPSTLSITLLSTLCNSGGVTPSCVPCQPVQVNCQPVCIQGCDAC